MVYKEVKAEPMRTTKSFSKDEIVEGTLLGAKSDVGKNKSMVYIFADKKGEKVEYWGSNALDAVMLHVPIGSRLKITCTDDKYQFPNGNVGRNFKVELDE